MATFRDYAKMSNLHLNLKKTMVIPLATEPLKNWQDALHTDCPSWKGTKVARWGKYLGYAVGPEGQVHNFTSCEEKLELRGKLWQSLPTGLHGACTAYNTYCASLPTYHLQLQDPTPTLLDTEKKTLRKCFAGPGNWCLPEDLWHLSSFGFPRDARKFPTLATAAQVRTAVW